jgi:IS1 family transposase
MRAALSASGVGKFTWRKEAHGNDSYLSSAEDKQAYAKLLPAKRHQVGKAGTRHIERHNLNFRTHVKRLQRRTICYSK